MKATWQQVRDRILARPELTPGAAASLTAHDWQTMPGLLTQLLAWHKDNPDNYFVHSKSLLLSRVGGRQYKRKVELLCAAGLLTCLDRRFSRRRSRPYAMPDVAACYRILGYRAYASQALAAQHITPDGDRLRLEGVQQLRRFSNLPALTARDGGHEFWRGTRAWDHRCYSEVMALAKTDRAALQLQSGEMFDEIDAACSYGWAAACWSFLQLSDRFKQAAAAGTLYDVVLAHCGAEITRKQAKEMVIQLFTHPNRQPGRNSTRQIVWNAFIQAFGRTDFAQIRRVATHILRHDDGSMVSHGTGAQRRSVSLFHAYYTAFEFDTWSVVLRDLQRRQILAVSTHDGLLVPQSRTREALEAIRRIVPGTVKLESTGELFTPIITRDSITSHTFGSSSIRSMDSALVSDVASRTLKVPGQPPAPQSTESIVVCKQSGLSSIRGELIQRKDLDRPPKTSLPQVWQVVAA